MRNSAGRRRQRKQSDCRMYIYAGIILGACALMLGGHILYKSVRFNQDIGGHLKRAADANTVALALKELHEANTNMDVWRLCSPDDPRKPNNCYAYVLWRTPAADVNYWRVNIKAIIDDLEAMPVDADHLKISNTLMKARESLLDNKAGGDMVTMPAGVYLYPHNRGIVVAFFFIVLAGVVIGVIAIRRSGGSITLIELMIILAILGILAGVLVPYASGG